jgi:hypothetical protein
VFFTAVLLLRVQVGGRVAVPQSFDSVCFFSGGSVVGMRRNILIKRPSLSGATVQIEAARSIFSPRSQSTSPPPRPQQGKNPQPTPSAQPTQN